MAHYVRRLRSIGLLSVLFAAGSLSVAFAASLGNGKVDTGFGSGGLANLGNDTQLLATATQSDGKIVAVGSVGSNGSNEHLLLARFTTSGRLDRQVTGPAGVIGRGVAVQADGKIVVAGQATNALGSTTNGMVAVRFNSSGSLDGRFGHGGVARISSDTGGSGNAVALMTDGRVVIAGMGTLTSGVNKGLPSVAVARLNSNGSLDRSFARTGSEAVDLGQLAQANAVAVQGDDKIVVGGSQRQGFRSTQALAARFNSSGSLDRSFAGGLFLRQYSAGAAYSAFNGLALQSDGKVVLSGGTVNTNGLSAIVVRLSSHGSPDGGFGSGGLTRLPASTGMSDAESPVTLAVTTTSGGRIVAAGWVDNQGLQSLTVWGLTSHGAIDGGFGSGGVTVYPVRAQLQGTGIAVIPGGKFAVSGTESTVSLHPTVTGFVTRLGGPSVSTKPSISRLRVSGTTVTYFDSLASQTRFTVLSCGRRGCTSSKGSFTVNDIAGANNFQFSAVHAPRLRRGSYALKATPKYGHSGGRSVTVKFRIR